MRKVLFLTVLALSCSLITKAQIQRGNLMVGGDIADFRLNLNEGGYFTMRINPKVGFFIKDNLAIGPYVNLGLTTVKGGGTSVDYGVGAFGRYYLNDTAINVVRHGRFFFEGNVGIEGNNPSGGSNTNGLGLGIGPGFAYFITPNVGLETMLKYQGIVGFGSNPTSSTLDLSVGFQIYLSSSHARRVADRLQ